MITVKSKSRQDTIELGQKIARDFKGGEVVALVGPLGAGKTTFTQGLLRGLNFKAEVTSPTFVIMDIYPTKKGDITQVCHVDAYRLQSAEELLDIGIEEYLGVKNSVTIIEWADRVAELLPDRYLLINCESGLKENERVYRLTQVNRP